MLPVRVGMARVGRAQARERERTLTTIRPGSRSPAEADISSQDADGSIAGGGSHCLSGGV